MRITEDIVKTATDQTGFKYQIDLPESIEEAIELYGANGVLSLLNTALKIKKQAIAREGFKQGKSVEEINEAVAAYRPGKGSKKSQAEYAFELMTLKADHLNLNPELKAEVVRYAVKKEYKEIVKLLESVG